MRKQDGGQTFRFGPEYVSVLTLLQHFGVKSCLTILQVFLEEVLFGHKLSEQNGCDCCPVSRDFSLKMAALTLSLISGTCGVSLLALLLGVVDSGMWDCCES